MANDIDKTSPHYKGEFGSIYEVNQMFPSGGVEGDYVAIDGWAHYWNADRGTWCVNAQRDSYWDELITGIIEKFKLFKGATYMGVANLDSVPAKAIGAKMYYFATVPGKYTNFGDLVVPQGINVLYSENGSSWVNSTLLEVAQELGLSTWKVVSQKVMKEALENETTARSDADKKHESRLLALEQSEWPLSLELSINPILIEFTGSEKDTSVAWKIMRKGVGVTPTALTFKQDGVALSAQPVANGSINAKVNKLGDTVFEIAVEAEGMKKSASKKLTMVLPVYCGFGTSVSDVAVDGNKLSPRTSASGTYSKTSTKNDVNFIILVPKTMPGLSSFTMGGAPFVMITSSVVVNRHDYYMYKSGGVYMSGTNVKVQAS